MNKKTSKWAFLPKSPVESETVQRIAFSFRYEWTVSGNSISHVCERVLCFDPSYKSISYSSSKDNADDQVCLYCSSIEEALGYFKTPPKIVASQTTSRGAVFGDGSVDVDFSSLSSAEFDELVKARKSVLGSTKKVPYISFSYRSELKTKKTLRRLFLLSETDDLISGLDVDDAKQFKHFRKDRISGDVVFLGFGEVVDN